MPFLGLKHCFRLTHSIYWEQEWKCAKDEIVGGTRDKCLIVWRAAKIKTSRG